LKKQFRILSKYSYKQRKVFSENNFPPQYKLLDCDETEITVDELIDKYFSHPETCFIKSYDDNTSNNDAVSEMSLCSAKTAVINNLFYSLEVSRKNNYFLSHPTSKTNFTKLPYNKTEDNIQETTPESQVKITDHPDKPSYPYNADLEKYDLSNKW
jgi:hypothetical protein